MHQDTVMDMGILMGTNPTGKNHFWKNCLTDRYAEK